MCNCVDIEVGTYDNQVTLPVPEHMSPRRNCLGDLLAQSICVDTCLAGEIQELWEAGIHTTGCCCGHNKHEPYIGVHPDDIQKMKDMGYEVRYNECRPGDEDSFVPKTRW